MFAYKTILYFSLRVFYDKWLYVTRPIQNKLNSRKSLKADDEYIYIYI